VFDADCDEVLGKKKKVCAAFMKRVPVLSKIVKRRYVRMNEQSFMPIGFIAVGSLIAALWRFACEA
jgi:hypothetical protein